MSALPLPRGMTLDAPAPHSLELPLIYHRELFVFVLFFFFLHQSDKIWHMKIFCGIQSFLDIEGTTILQQVWSCFLRSIPIRKMFLKLNLRQKQRHTFFLSLSIRIFWLRHNESLQSDFFSVFQ